MEDKREIIYQQVSEPIWEQCNSKKGRCYGDGDRMGCVCGRGEATLREDVSGEGTCEPSFDDKQFTLYVLQSLDHYGPSLRLQSEACVLPREQANRMECAGER